MGGLKRCSPVTLERERKSDPNGLSEMSKNIKILFRTWDLLYAERGAKPYTVII